MKGGITRKRWLPCHDSARNESCKWSLHAFFTIGRETKTIEEIDGVAATVIGGLAY
jgi:hypothetical protein